MTKWGYLPHRTTYNVLRPYSSEQGEGWYTGYYNVISIGNNLYFLDIKKKDRVFQVNVMRNIVFFGKLEHPFFLQQEKFIMPVSYIRYKHMCLVGVRLGINGSYDDNINIIKKIARNRKPSWNYKFGFDSSFIPTKDQPFNQEMKSILPNIGRWIPYSHVIADSL